VSRVVRSALLAAGIACALAACQPGAPDAPVAETPPAAATPAASAPATPPPMREPVLARLRGAAIMGKDGYGVTLCGESAQRILAIDPAAQGMLDGFVSGGVREFHLDATGELLPDGRARIAGIERIYTEGQGCDEALDAVQFRARGTEPFWSMDVGGGELVLERPDAEPVRGPVRDLGESRGTRNFEAATPAGRLFLRLSPAHCNDGMSDTLYGWRAEGTLGRETFAGCAFRGLAKPAA
jgi:putative lipoprotein